MKTPTLQGGLPVFLDVLRERLGANLVSLSTLGEAWQHSVATSAPVGIALSFRDTPLSESVCHHVHRMNFPLVISDILSHPLLSDLPGLRQSLSGAYLGYPVRDAEGRVVAVLAAIHDRIHHWERDEIEVMAKGARDALPYLLH